MEAMHDASYWLYTDKLALIYTTNLWPAEQMYNAPVVTNPFGSISCPFMGNFC